MPSATHPQGVLGPLAAQVGVLDASLAGVYTKHLHIIVTYYIAIPSIDSMIKHKGLGLITLKTFSKYFETIIPNETLIIIYDVVILVYISKQVLRF